MSCQMLSISFRFKRPGAVSVSSSTVSLGCNGIAFDFWFVLCVAVSVPCLRLRKKIPNFLNSFSSFACSSPSPLVHPLLVVHDLGFGISLFIFVNVKCDWADWDTGIQVPKCTRHKVIELGSAPNNKKRINATNQRIQKKHVLFSIFPSFFFLLLCHPSFLFCFRGERPFNSVFSSRLWTRSFVIYIFNLFLFGTNLVTFSLLWLLGCWCYSLVEVFSFAFVASFYTRLNIWWHRCFLRRVCWLPFMLRRTWVLSSYRCEHFVMQSRLCWLSRGRFSQRAWEYLPMFLATVAPIEKLGFVNAEHQMDAFVLTKVVPSQVAK